MAEMPTIKDCCDALADAVEAGGAPTRAQQLRDHPVELDEAAFASLAAELLVQPLQLYQAYLFRVAQTTGFVHRALAHARLQEVTLQ